MPSIPAIISGLRALETILSEFKWSRKRERFIHNGTMQYPLHADTFQIKPRENETPAKYLGPRAMVYYALLRRAGKTLS